MSQTRQLAAIMFTDIVGYTALMGKDEQKAFELLKRNREIHKLLIKKYHGTWIKELGDGVLVSFQTATDAVYCAAAIHQACNAVDGLTLRIGIHLGEVVFENHDVFGDGVNIASRLQAIANIGSTWVSEALYKNLANKKEFTAEFIKEETLKNVSEPVKIYEITIKDIPGYRVSVLEVHGEKNTGRKTARKKAMLLVAILIFAGLMATYFMFVNKRPRQTSFNNPAEIKSIAVLYFTNMTGDSELEYLSDAITEEITSHLGKIKGLDVRSRTSVFSLKGKTINIKKIAEELKVSTLVEGSVMKSGDRIKITAQLINGETDKHFWAAAFTKELKDLFELQSDVARAIAKELEIELSTDARAKINHNPTANIEAYESFQKGYYFLYKKYLQSRLAEDLERSKQFFERAIELDGNYAEAYAGLAEFYDVIRNNNEAAFPDSLLVLKQHLARKALQLNPKSSFVNTAMAWSLAHFPGEPKFDSMFFFLKQAYFLNPSDALTNWNLGSTLSILGLHLSAIPFCLQALKADPVDPNNYALLGVQYTMLGRNAEAKQAFHKSLELANERFFSEFAVLVWLIYLGDMATVEERLKPRLQEIPKGYGAKFLRSYFYASKGEPEKIDTAVRNRNEPLILLVVNGNKIVKEVIRQLEKEMDNPIVRAPDWKYEFLNSSFYYDAYRSDPDFKRVLAKSKRNYDALFLKYGKIELPE